VIQNFFTTQQSNRYGSSYSARYLFNSKEGMWGYVGTYQDVLILLVSPLVSLSAADESKFESESKESIPKNEK
jgi:hypothetical protein